MIATNDDTLAALALQYRNHGSNVRYHHSVIGYNSRLDELQAVVLRAKLPHIDDYNAGRRRVAQIYQTLLADTPVQTPAMDVTGHHVFHQYCCLSPKREKIMEALTKAKISSAIYYPVPLHKQAVFAQDFAGLSLPVSEFIASQCFALPMYPELTDDKIQQVVDTIKSVF